MATLDLDLQSLQTVINRFADVKTTLHQSAEGELTVEIPDRRTSCKIKKAALAADVKLGDVTVRVEEAAVSGEGLHVRFHVPAEQ